MKLRDYQNEAVEGVMRTWEDNASALVVLPTGLGKTVVFADIVSRMQPARAMVVAHREELIFQARDKIAAVTGLEAEVEMADYHADGMLGRLPPVVVSTIQTQTAGGDGGGRMTKFEPDDFGLLVIDEAHHATSKSYRRVIDYYRRNPKLKVLGVTATPDRADESALGQVFDSVAYNYEIVDAIKNGWLVPIEQQMVTVGSLDFSACRTVANDFNQGDLAEVMEEEHNLHGVAEPTVEICGKRRCIVFATTVAQAERLAEIINRYRPDSAAFVCGKTDKEARHKVLADFKAGRLQFIVNVGVLTEGFDDAGVEVIVMARPTESRALYAQMAGRGTRPAEDIAGKLGDMDAAGRRAAIAASPKPRCLIVDFAGNSGKHKLVCTADILGGNEDDEVVELAAAHVRESQKPVDMEEEIAKARAEVEARKRREAAGRALLRARASFLMTKVDPFNVWDISPAKERGWDAGRHFSPKQAQVLMDRIGVDPAKIPYGQGKQLLDEYFRRVKGGLCSLKQQVLLAKNGIVGPVSMEEAGRIITRLAERQGWGRREAQ